ncbi:MAG: YciI family protein [Arenicellales bacterium]
MLYVIWATDVANSLEKRAVARPDHVTRLKSLAEQGRLIIAGPMPAVDSAEPGEAGMTGSMIVAEFTFLDAAKTWADEDPYIEAGVYENVVVKPYIKVLP